MESGEELCRACGLCCDGTLFHHVTLEPGDDAKRLKALGLPVGTSRARAPVARFPQPCAGLCADRTCRLYADRPQQCRTFACGVFKNVQAGRLALPPALKLVKEAREQSDHIRDLLRELGDADEHRSLNERFRQTRKRMEEGFADEAEGDRFADLSLAMHHFGLLTQEKFYTKAEAEP